MTMTSEKILITGSTGLTATAAIDALLGSGKSLRALVRSEDARSERLRSLGVEVVQGDLLSLADVRHALVGIDTAYLCYSEEEGMVQATAFFAQAAIESSLGALVNMSNMAARADAPSMICRDHWISEQLLGWSGVPTVHVRPTFFTEWLTYPFLRYEIARHDRLTLPFESGRHAPIAGADVGRFVAALLNDPQPHVGKLYRLYGPVETSWRGMTEIVGEAIGRPIEYRLTDPASFLEPLSAMGIPPRVVQHFSAAVGDYPNGIFQGSDDLFERITGKPAITPDRFFREHKDLFVRKGI